MMEISYSVLRYDNGICLVSQTLSRAFVSLLEPSPPPLFLVLTHPGKSDDFEISFHAVRIPRDIDIDSWKFSIFRSSGRQYYGTSNGWSFSVELSLANHRYDETWENKTTMLRKFPHGDDVAMICGISNVLTGSFPLYGIFGFSLSCAKLINFRYLGYRMMVNFW